MQALSPLLLYKYERKQFKEVKDSHKSQPLAHIYGAEHLLRPVSRLCCTAAAASQWISSSLPMPCPTAANHGTHDC